MTLSVASQLQRGVTSFDNQSAVRWAKPTFQAFQLRTLNTDQEEGEDMRTSLGIFGPQVQSEISRAKSVPIREKDQWSRDEVRTAQSSVASHDMISLKPRSSMEAMPVRPPLSRHKQIPGRYFPKAATPGSTRVVSFSMFRQYRPPVRARTMNIGNSRSLDTNNLPYESVTFLDAIPRQRGQQCFDRLYRPRRSQTEIKEQNTPDIFAICFNAGNGSPKKNGEDTLPALGQPEREKTVSSYDPNSELHSDYYTIKRVTANSSSVGKPSIKRNFAVVLRGQPKLLHPKLILESEQRQDGKGMSSNSGSSHDIDRAGRNGFGRSGHGEIAAFGAPNTPPSSEKIELKIDSGRDEEEEGEGGGRGRSVNCRGY